MTVQKILSLLKKRFVLNLYVSLVLIVLASIVATSLMFRFDTISTPTLMLCIDESGYILLLLNWLPVFLVMLLLFFITNNTVAATCFPTLVVIIMSVINHYKIYMRMSPFMPWDVFLGGETLAVSKSFDMSIVIGVAWKLAILLLLTALAFVFFRNKKIGMPLRIGGLLLSIAAIFFVNLTLLSNKDINEKLYIDGNVYSEVNQYNSKGFLYSFIYNANTNKITKPAQYDPAKIQTFIQKYPKTDYSKYKEIKKPHILIIMSEAYSDMGLNPAFDFSGYTDPLEHYKTIRNNSISGYIITPNMGGGTADTEFDVLTGINSRHFRGIPYSYSILTKPFDSMASELKKIGYQNIAIHPGHEWFYNRLNVYSYLGFDQFIDLKHFDEAKNNKGMYINETATFDRIIDEFEEHIANSRAPFFEFCVTIQNHGPYKNKYAAPKNFNTTATLDPDDENALANYFLGQADNDRELKRLTDYLQAHHEPVVLLYFGDHIPSFSQSVYDAFYPSDDETESGHLRLLKSPYLIWQNDSAKQIVDLSGVKPEHEMLSSHYLGVMLLDLLGLSDLNPFFSYVSATKKEYPVILEQQYYDKDGILHELTDDNTIQNAHNWEYFKLFAE